MTPVRPIVAAVDFSAASPAVVHHALHAAEQTRAPLRLVHVIDSAVLSQHALALGQVPPLETLLDRARERLKEMIPATESTVPCEFIIRQGHPGEELHEIVDECDAGLLVLAANDLTKHHPGSVASACIRTIPCDVLVLREWQGRNYREILTCIDLTEGSARALEQGISLALLHTAELEIAYVMYPPSRDVWGGLLQPEPDEKGSSYSERCRSGVRQAVERFLSTEEGRLRHLKHRITILESVTPAQALKYHVLDTKPELVVVGSKLHSRFSRFFSAGIADHLLHETPASVLAVREADKKSPSESLK
jgi:universal stress protein E